MERSKPLSRGRTGLDLHSRLGGGASSARLEQLRGPAGSPEGVRRKVVSLYRWMDVFLRVTRRIRGCLLMSGRFGDWGGCNDF